MFIALLTYVRPLAEVDALIPAHGRFLDEHYASGLFVLSGRKLPRTGGVILINSTDAQHVGAIIEQDPFKQAGVAQYELIEWIPTRAQSTLAALLA